MTTVTRYLEALGGPLDGEVVEFPGPALEYWYIQPDRATADRYRVAPWIKRDSEGGRIWERECLLHAESMSGRDLLS